VTKPRAVHARSSDANPLQVARERSANGRNAFSREIQKALDIPSKKKSGATNGAIQKWGHDDKEKAVPSVADQDWPDEKEGGGSDSLEGTAG